MSYYKTILLFTSILLLNACSTDELPVTEGGYYHSGIYFGSNFPDVYQKGIRDGCTTSKGSYKKSHPLFQNKKEYADGWFLGRNRCKNLLVIDDKMEDK